MNKKTLSFVNSTVLIILAAIFTVFAFLPALTLSIADHPYLAEFYTDGFEDAVPVTEAEFGFSTVVSFVKYLPEILKEDRPEALLRDEEYVRMMFSVYAITGYMAQEEEDTGGSDPYDDYLMPMVMRVFEVISFIGIVLVAIIFPIILLINFIVKLIQYLLGLRKNADAEKTERRMGRFPFAGYAVSMLILFGLFGAFAQAPVGMGVGVVGCLVIWLVSCVLNLVKGILAAGQNRVKFIVKQAITLVSVVAVVLVLACFTNIGILNEYAKDNYEMCDTYYKATAEDLLEAGEDPDHVDYLAKKEVESAQNLNVIVLVLAVMVGVIFLLITLVCVIDRFGNKTYKHKVTGKDTAYGQFIALAVILCLVAAVPMMFGTSSTEDKVTAFEKGQYKMGFTDYEEEGTSDYREYQTCVETLDLTNQLIEEADEAIADTDDEQNKQEIISVKQMLVATRDSYEVRIEDMEKQGSRATLCIVGAVLFLLAEIAFAVVKKVIPDKPETAAVAETVAVPVVEAAPVEKASVEEIPAEEASVEEASAEAEKAPDETPVAPEA